MSKEDANGSIATEFLIGLREIASALGTTERHVSAMIRDGDLPAKFDGRRYTTAKPVLYDWIRQAPGEAA